MMAVAYTANSVKSNPYILKTTRRIIIGRIWRT